jgi:uncharacterized protein YjaZ
MENEILLELKKMNKLLALNLTKDQDALKSIFQLKNAGYSHLETAEIIGTTKKAVDMAIYHNKKKINKNGKNKKEN